MQWITCEESPKDLRDACTAGRYLEVDQCIYTQAQIENRRWHLWVDDVLTCADELDKPQWLMQFG